MNDPSQYRPVGEKRFPWGCLLGGCLSVVLLFVIGIGASGFGLYWYLSRQIDQYTSTQPESIPITEYSKEQIGAVKKRLDDFKAALDSGAQPETLELSADDINALISQNDEFKGRIFVSIDDGKISAQISYPLDKFPLGKGRYFNGKVTLKASLENGVLIVTLDDAVVNGAPVPAKFLDEMRDQNMAKDTYKDPKVAEFLRKFDRLTIDDDKLILVPVPPKPPKADAGESSSPSAIPAAPQAEVTDLPATSPDK